MTNFPTGLDDFATQVALQEADAALANAWSAAIEAIEAKLGADGSAVAGSIDKKLQGVTTAFTPVVTPATGAITAYAANGAYFNIGKLYFVTWAVVLTNNGTGAGLLKLTYPVGTARGVTIGNGRNADTGGMLQGIGSPNDAFINVLTYDNFYPVATGQTIYMFAVVEIN